MLEQIFGQNETGDRVDRIIGLTERIRKIQSAADFIKYDNKLVFEIPDTLKLLGAAIEEATAELKQI